MRSENKKILAVGAHPDDVEFMCSGTMAMLRNAGCELHVASMSLGDCGSLEHSAREVRRIRRREAEAACKVLGATYHYVGFSDFCMYNDDRSNRRVTALLREIDPWVVITHPPRDYLSDHEATSALVRNACFYAPVPNYATKDLTPVERSSGIPYLFYTHPLEGLDIFGGKTSSQFYADVSEWIQLKKQMLACHESQRNWLRAHHGIDEYIDSMLRWSAELGQKASQASARSIRFAEAFRQHLGHAYPRANVLVEILQDRIILNPTYGSER